MKTRKTIKSLVCALFAVIIMTFAGCDARIDVYESSDDDFWYFRIDIGIPQAVDSLLNESAAASKRHNSKKWTLQTWFDDYFSDLSELYGFTYSFDGVYNDEAARQKVYRFNNVQIPKRKGNEYLSDGLTLSGEYDVKTNLFFRTINTVRADRFNFWQKELDEAKARFDEGEQLLKDNNTAMGILIFGLIEIFPQYENKPNHPDIIDNPDFIYDSESGMVYREVLPGFTEAFPAAELGEYTEIMLRNFWYASQKMNVECDDRLYVQDSNGTPDKKGVYYVFQKNVGDGETLVTYQYRRADPTGWYIVAIVAGGITVGLTVLAARVIKKQKEKLPPPKPKDSFPYDPFEGNIDPFA